MPCKSQAHPFHFRMIGQNIKRAHTHTYKYIIIIIHTHTTHTPCESWFTRKNAHTVNNWHWLTIYFIFFFPFRFASTFDVIFFFFISFSFYIMYARAFTYTTIRKQYYAQTADSYALYIYIILYYTPIHHNKLRHRAHKNRFSHLYTHGHAYLYLYWCARHTIRIHNNMRRRAGFPHGSRLGWAAWQSHGAPPAGTIHNTQWRRYTHVVVRINYIYIYIMYVKTHWYNMCIRKREAL